ncbi:MAG: DUF1501 domain-containing protein [Nannocystales bacterium]
MRMNNRMTRRGLLTGSAAAIGAGWGVGLLGSRPALADVGSPKNLIIVNAVGGWDTTYTIDPKPGLSSIDAPSDGTVREIGGIPILDAATRPSVASYFEDFASITTVINGLQTSSISHTSGYRRIMTGTTALDAPDIGTIAAIEHGNDLAAPYLVLGTVSFSGPYASAVTRTGNLNQINTLIEPAAGFPLEDGSFGFERFLMLDEEQGLVQDYVRAQAQQGRERWQGLGRNSQRGADFENAIGRAEQLVDIGALGDLDYAQSFGLQVDLAIQALSLGTSAACQIELGGWDTHVNNSDQVFYWEELFSQLRRLVQGLEAAGLMEDTVVAVVSEMGRTPKLNGDAGKDHWPVTSAMLIGTDIGGGRVLGATDDEFGGRNVELETGELSGGGSPLRHGNFAAGVLEEVGVDPTAYLGSSTPLRGF